MPKRSLTFLLFWALGCTAVAGEESVVLADPMRPHGERGAVDDAGPAFRLTGVLISPSGRVAILNGELVAEGGRVDGAEVLSIDTGQVRIRTGSRELSLSLGADAASDRRAAALPARDPRPQSAPETESASASVAYEAQTPDHLDSRYGPVRKGETLSSIAQRHLGDGVTIDQMMIALFQANPGAFRGNINVLFEGAILRIPVREERLLETPAAATAEVNRQRLEWPGSEPQRTGLTSVADARVHGPVQRGETLSGIAQQHLSDGVTMNQMMIALFQANPRAFSGNINVLFEGSVLRIPDGHALRHQPPETATAEVARQTALWREGSWRQARMASPAGGDLEPHTEEGSELTGRAVVPSRGSEPLSTIVSTNPSEGQAAVSALRPLVLDRASFVEDVPADGGHGLHGLRP